MGFLRVKQSWMCKRVGNITEVPECDVGARAVGGWVVLLCSLCENIAFFPGAEGAGAGA